MKKLFGIFATFFKIGLFTFGGGFAMIPLIEEEMINKKKWLDKDEFMDIIVLSQSLPGPFAVNASIFVGYKIAGVIGGLLSFLGAVLPSFSIILLVAAYFMQFRNNYYVNKAFMGISAAVPMRVLIAVASLSKAIDKNSRNFIIIAVALFILLYFKVNPIYIIIGSALYGLIFLRKKVE